jgi:hypothetical protein
MPAITIRESIPEDVAILAGSLREEDNKEASAQWGSALFAIQKSYDVSKDRFTLDLRGKPVAMFGLVEQNKDTANIWLLGTPGLAKIKKSFIILSVEIIKEFLAEYPTLWAQVDRRYQKTFRWLKWLGAIEQPTYKLNGVDFNNFVFRRA